MSDTIKPETPCFCIPLETWRNKTFHRLVYRGQKTGRIPKRIPLLLATRDTSGRLEASPGFLTLGVRYDQRDWEDLGPVPVSNEMMESGRHPSGYVMIPFNSGETWKEFAKIVGETMIALGVKETIVGYCMGSVVEEIVLAERGGSHF